MMRPLARQRRNQLEDRLRLLELAIRKHRDERGHDRCWLDDDELYTVLGEPVPDRPLPPTDEFLARCALYRELRERGGAHTTPDPLRLLIQRLKYELDVTRVGVKGGQIWSHDPMADRWLRRVLKWAERIAAGDPEGLAPANWKEP